MRSKRTHTFRLTAILIFLLIASPVLARESNSSTVSPNQEQSSTESTGYGSMLSDGDYRWHTFYGSPAPDEGSAVAVDENGAIYVAGYSENTWNGPSGQMPLHGFTGLEDLMIVKLDISGNYQWHTFYGSANFDYASGIALDNQGGVYISACSTSSWVGPAGQAPLHSYSGGLDISVIKLDENGSYQWHSFFGSPDDDCSTGIAQDGLGGLYITGYSDNSWNGPAGQLPLHAHSISSDIDVLKLSTSGDYVWHTFYGSSASQWGQAITLDAYGGVYIAGTSENTWNGPAGQPPLHAHSGSNDIAVLKIDSTGDYRWHSFYGSEDGDWGFGIAVDCAEGVYITGSSRISWLGPAGQAALNAHSGADDIPIIKLDPSGEYQWHTFYGASQIDFGDAIAAGGSGGVHIVGASDNSWNGPAGQPPKHAHSGYKDILVLKLDPSGEYQWHTFYGEGGNLDKGLSLALTGTQSIIVTGYSSQGWKGPGGQLPLNPFNGYYDMALIALDGTGMGASISGKIIGYSGNPLPGVSVSTGLGCAAITDAEGKYSIKDIKFGEYLVTPRMTDYIFNPQYIPVSLPPDAPGQDFSGFPLVGDMLFRPDPDGYSFKGYGAPSSGIYSGSDFRRMFSDAEICYPYLPGCATINQARLWYETIAPLVDDGNGYGMSVSSLRFFSGTDHIIDSGDVYSLGKTDEVSILWNGKTFITSARENIGFFSAAQFLDPVRYNLDGAFLLTPQEILSQIEQEMNNGGTNPIALLLLHESSNGRVATDTVVPYALSNPAPGEWLIWVYDSNFPGAALRYLVIDTNSNSWTYDLGGDWGVWSGNASSQDLGLIANSIHNQPVQCPWCSDATSQSLFLSGDGHLLVTDSQGRQLGFVGSQFVDQMPDGYGTSPFIFPGVGIEPIYTLPITDAYTILLDGQLFDLIGTASITQVGPGYSISLKNLDVNVTTQDQLFISNDGTAVSYHASSAQTPALSIALSGLAANYNFQLKGVDIGSDKTFSLSTDISNGDLTINGSQLTGGEYNLFISMLSPGGKSEFYHGNVLLNSSDTHIINFGPWNGSGTIILEIDYGSDGTIDETVELDNQLVNVFVPVMRAP